MLCFNPRVDRAAEAEAGEDVEEDEEDAAYWTQINTASLAVVSIMELAPDEEARQSLLLPRPLLPVFPILARAYLRRVGR